MSERIKVLLADDHKILVAGLKMSIDEWEEFEVVGVANNGKEAVEACENVLPDIILMDMQMPVMSGTEATHIIKNRFPNVKVVALTTFDDSETVTNAMKEGCDGFLLKVIAPEQLRSSLHSIMDGISVVDKEAMAKMRNQLDAKKGCDLNPRELEILRYICKGLTNKEIAENLSLQPGTVKNMVSLLLSKTYCVSRADLTRYAIENDLLKD